MISVDWIFSIGFLFFAAKEQRSMCFEKPHLKQPPTMTREQPRSKSDGASQGDLSPQGIPSAPMAPGT